MSPLREFRSLTNRFDEDIKIEPLRRYYLIFEGANTVYDNLKIPKNIIENSSRGNI